MVCIGQIVESSQVNREDAHGRAPNSHGGYNPGHRRERSPAKPEQADGQEDGLDTDEVQPSLGGRVEPSESCGDLFLPDADEGDQDNADTHG